MSLAILLATLVLAFVVFSPSALAQCAMCKTALTGPNAGASTAKTMNLAILVLLIPPVTIFCSVFALAFKHRKPRDGQE